ncbi:MAG: hypothetical protein GXO96_12160 [Nitrospirae bacterium]|nr:hypothetical protein [Candidatus Manganitrophaceae bacterium]
MFVRTKFPLGVFFFLLSIVISSAPVSAQIIPTFEVKATSSSSEKSGLSGSIRFDVSTGATHYKVKIKSFGEVMHVLWVPIGEDFQIAEIAPGYYDLVIEAKGHTTLVSEDVILIKKKRHTHITVKMLKAKTIFQDGDGTKTIMCSACHKKIYKEMIFGEGADFYTGPWPGPDGTLIHLPDLQRDFYKNGSPKHLAYVSPITVASIAKQPKEKQDACRTCHAPTRILQGPGEVAAPKLRDNNRLDGVSCASCHLDQEGNIRGKYDLSAPHPTVQDPLFTAARSAELCAACHQTDYSAPAQQTFLEWKNDFAPNDARTCQSCHMPRDVRLFSEIFSDRPKRIIGRHLFAGGHSVSILEKAATLSLIQDLEHPKQVQIAVTNSGAGHSLPTGHGPRAVLLHLKLEGPDGRILIDSEKKGSAVAVYTVDPGLGGGSETIHPGIRAGATEVISLQLGNISGVYRIGVYRISARLYYDLDRLVDYNDHDLPLIASLETTVVLTP